MSGTDPNEQKGRVFARSLRATVFATTLITVPSRQWHFFQSVLFQCSGKGTHWEEQQLEGDDVTRVCVAGCYFPELAVCLKRLCDALLNVAVDLVPVWSLQKHLPATGEDGYKSIVLLALQPWMSAFRFWCSLNLLLVFLAIDQQSLQEHLPATGEDGYKRAPEAKSVCWKVQRCFGTYVV